LLFSRDPAHPSSVIRVRNSLTLFPMAYFILITTMKDSQLLKNHTITFVKSLLSHKVTFIS
jgi:hypothetical protein